MVPLDFDAGAAGKRRRRSFGTFLTRKEAEYAERQTMSAKDRGIELAPSTTAVSGFLNRFIASRDALRRGVRTGEEYMRVAALYIDPHLGCVVLSKLRPAHVSA